MIRERALVCWAHLYLLLTFRWWYATPHSFSVEGLDSLRALPVWGLESLPRLPLSGVTALLEVAAVGSLLGALLSTRTDTLEQARRLLWPLLCIKLYLYLLDLRLFTTYHHMHLLMAVLIAGGASLLLLRLGLLQIYLFSALGKFNDSWLQGAYFKSIDNGLPLLGTSSSLLTAAAWAVILLELFGPILWFLPWERWRRGSVILFLGFHLYSGLIVGFRYPLLMLPLCYLLLWPLHKPAHKGYRFNQHDLSAWLLLSITFLFGWLPFFLPSDTRYTAEGRYFSIGNMFDANRRTYFQATLYRESTPYVLRVERSYPAHNFYDASTTVLLSRSGQPFQHLKDSWEWEGKTVVNPAYFQETHLRTIGDPYLYLYFLKQASSRLDADRLEAELESSLNRGAERTVFEIKGSPEQLPIYSPWGGNEWLP